MSDQQQVSDKRTTPPTASQTDLINFDNNKNPNNSKRGMSSSLIGTDRVFVQNYTKTHKTHAIRKQPLVGVP